MDTIALRRVDVPDYEPVFSFSINGRELTDILRAHGCEDCELTLWSVVCHRECTVFAEEAREASGRFVVLICGCGVLGCSNTTVKVTRTGEVVTWSDFASGWQDGVPEFSKAGPFQFAAEQYDAFLAEGRRLADEEDALQEDHRKQRDAEAARQSDDKPGEASGQPAESA